MATSTIRQLLALSVLLGALAACAANPTPRGYAQQGVPYAQDQGIHNASYYQGADPSHLRQRSDGGP